MKPTTERDSTSIELTDEDGGCIRFDRGEDKDWYAVTSAQFVTLTPQQADALAAFLRDDPTPPPRFTVRESPVSTGSWVVLDSTVDRFIGSFNQQHPDPEGAARREADRLNEGTH
jgi:hypothetical protein